MPRPRTLILQAPTTTPTPAPPHYHPPAPSQTWANVGPTRGPRATWIHLHPDPPTPPGGAGRWLAGRRRGGPGEEQEAEGQVSAGTDRVLGHGRPDEARGHVSRSVLVDGSEHVHARLRRRRLIPSATVLGSLSRFLAEPKLWTPGPPQWWMLTAITGSTPVRVLITRRRSRHAPNRERLYWSMATRTLATHRSPSRRHWNGTK